MIRRQALLATTLLILTSAVAAHATTPSRSCQAAKLKAVAKYTLCRLKADAKAVKTDSLADYSRCDLKIAGKWPTVDGIDCPAMGDLAAVQEEATMCTSSLQNSIGGGSTPGHVFADNGDGTISDTATGLMWEKKTARDNVANPANLHDVDNYYSWSAHCTGDGISTCQPTAEAASLCSSVSPSWTVTEPVFSPCKLGCDIGHGPCEVWSNTITTVWDWVSQLNTANFGGHSDWRIPTLEEIQTLLDYDATSGLVVNSAFRRIGCDTGCSDISDQNCSCTNADLGYLTTNVPLVGPGGVYILSFGNGGQGYWDTNNWGFVRAVRGGH